MESPPSLLRPPPTVISTQWEDVKSCLARIGNPDDDEPQAVLKREDASLNGWACRDSKGRDRTLVFKPHDIQAVGKLDDGWTQFILNPNAVNEVRLLIHSVSWRNSLQTDLLVKVA